MADGGCCLDDFVVASGSLGRSALGQRSAIEGRLASIEEDHALIETWCAEVQRSGASGQALISLMGEIVDLIASHIMKEEGLMDASQPETEAHKDAHAGLLDGLTKLVLRLEDDGRFMANIGGSQKLLGGLKEHLKVMRRLACQHPSVVSLQNTVSDLVDRVGTLTRIDKVLCDHPEYEAARVPLTSREVVRVVRKMMAAHEAFDNQFMQQVRRLHGIPVIEVGKDGSSCKRGGRFHIDQVLVDKRVASPVAALAARSISPLRVSALV